MNRAELTSKLIGSNTLWDKVNENKAKFRRERGAIITKYNKLPTVNVNGQNGLQRALAVEDNSSAMIYMRKVYNALHPLVDVECTGVVNLIETAIEIKKFFVEKQVAIEDVTNSIITFLAPYSGGSGYHAFIVALDEPRICNIYQSNGCHTQLFETTTTYTSFLEKYDEIIDIKREAMKFSEDIEDNYVEEGEFEDEILSLFRRIVSLEEELYHHDIFKYILSKVIISVVNEDISNANPILENFHPDDITIESILTHFEEKKTQIDPQEYEDYNGEKVKFDERRDLPVLWNFFKFIDTDEAIKTIRQEIARAIKNYKKDQFSFKVFKHVGKSRKTRKKAHSFDSYKRKPRRTKNRLKSR